MIEDYSRHAVVWDWDGFDNTPEYEYWCEYASKFGTEILIPMCALGSAGAFMAENGFKVTAFDLTDEMICEGKKRFGDIENLSLVTANICDFDFECKSFNFVFIKDQDLHLLQTIDNVKEALTAINSHMRKGGCLVLELTLPSKEYSYFPRQTFQPRVPNYTNKKVWKEGECRYDADEKKNYIDQTVFIKSGDKTEQFDYSVCLQYYDRNVLLEVLLDCGFSVMAEYSDRQFTAWKNGDIFWSVELIKN